MSGGREGPPGPAGRFPDRARARAALDRFQAEVKAAADRHGIAHFAAQAAGEYDAPPGVITSSWRGGNNFFTDCLAAVAYRRSIMDMDAAIAAAGEASS